MKELTKKWWFWVIVALLLLIAYSIYQMVKIPDSFEITTTSLLGAGETINRYENRDGNYFKITKTKILGQETKVTEVQITKQEYKDAYNNYFI